MGPVAGGSSAVKGVGNKGGYVVRKLIGFDPETQQALDLLSRDSGKSLQQLADEAFGDLSAKHNRPRTLKDALKQGAKRGPANENLKADPAPDSRVS